MRAKTQHKLQKFTRASVVKSDMISLESLAGKMFDHSKYITSSGVHYKLLSFGIEMCLNHCFPQVASAIRALNSIREPQNGIESLIQ